ncbi:hypothetical protein CFOL_v3_07024 [Cephalotus follicularis]|uniref:Uncharacterized protein n=1 Tax=Cephalotus follicularis TaxID=3775 RepID=A0A1Q3B620_CEPFO|nr:hypothetical protein CFOL_v3_07024 [Cephalotus follicularis]
MAEAEDDLGFGSAKAAHPPSVVTLAQFSHTTSPCPRRLSSSFTQPSRPVSSARKMAWVSLQGRLVNAEEATSARAIGGGLSRDESVAWELFTPFERFLIVAVVGVSSAESKKNRLIRQLKKSVELRDHVLTSMQQKLDNLCEQLTTVKDQAESRNMSFNKNVESPWNETLKSDKIQFVDCGCWLCDDHHGLFTGLAGHSFRKASAGEEKLQNHTNDAEPEERRMSDLSDWGSSVTSSVEIQMNTFATEQDLFNLKRECEEKDTTIKELTTFLQSSGVAGSKRIADLEDIIRRKNMTITRLKKDMVVLEQKVVQLTRLRRPSHCTSSSNSWQIPVMADNLLYDMDSTTSPSSSDSDSQPASRSETPVAKVDEIRVEIISDSVTTRNQKPIPAKSSSSLVRLTNQLTKSLPVSILQENSANQKSGTPAGQKQLSASGDYKGSRRRIQPASKGAAPQKRWT